MTDTRLRDVGALDSGVEAPGPPRSSSTRLTRVALSVGFAAYVALFAALLALDARYAPLVLAATAPLGLIALVLLLRHSRLSTAGSVVAIGGGAAALQAAALSAGPSTSDDVYRYVWDARVQLSGVDPYRYTPQAPQLAHLRDGLLFGPSSTCAHPIPGGCTAINRPDVHTVYPPVAQALFDVVRVVSGGAFGVGPFQLAAALGVLAVTAVLLWAAQRRGGPLWPVAIWAWSPLVVIEYGNNAHIDWAGVLLSVLALLLARSGRVGWAGGLLGAATLTKLYPALLFAAVMRRRPWVVLASAGVLVAGAYLPHVLAVGRAVIGYLPGYLHEEGYSTGSRTLLLGAVLPPPLDTVVGVVLLLAAAAWCWRHSRPETPEDAATVFVGVALLVATPAYGWYGGLLLALVVMSARYEWLPVVLAPNLAYLVREEITRSSWPESLIYAAAALAVGAMVVARRHRVEPSRERVAHG